MKLLPPKPPTSAGTAKSGKKKEKKEDTSKEPSVLEDDLKNSYSETAVPQETNEKIDDAGELHQDSLDATETDSNIPSISPADDLQNLDETLAAMNADSEVKSEKKKGLFARLFGKRKKTENVYSAQTSDFSATASSVPADEIQPVETAMSAEAGKENQTSVVPAQETLEDVANNEDLPSFDSEVSAKNYSGKIGSSTEEAMNGGINNASGVVAYQKNYSGKDKYKKDYYSGKMDSKNYVGMSYSSSSDYKMKKDDSSHVDDLELPEDWGADSLKPLEKSENMAESEDYDVDFTKEISDEPLVLTNKKEKSKPKEVELKKKGKKESKEIKDSVEELPDFEEAKVALEKINSNPDFTSPINDWKNQVIIAASKSKTDAKSLKQFNAKIKKMLKSYESKLLRVAADEKKSISLEIKKANGKIEEIHKKEKELSAKEQKLLHLGKSLSKEREEFDELVETEQQLMKNKEILEADVLKSARELADLKAEMSSVRKAFNTDKKAILYEKEKLQSEFKDFRVMIENERKKGEKKLLELSKQVELANSELDETLKKNRTISFKLKNKEVQLQQREKEVSELIAQEQKIISVLKGGDQSAMEHHSIRQRKKKEAPKPVTVIDVDGEPEIYSDDGDAIASKIQDCKDIIKEGNFVDAKLLYNEIRSSFVQANVDADRKKELSHEIRELYDEICLGMVSPKN